MTSTGLTSNAILQPPASEPSRNRSRPQLGFLRVKTYSHEFARQ
jgi:hypothetical protein